MVGPKPLIFLRFHGVFLGSQHKIWSKLHNGKVRPVQAEGGVGFKISTAMSTARRRGL
jgi:hypothetical protein